MFPWFSLQLFLGLLLIIQARTRSFTNLAFVAFVTLTAAQAAYNTTTSTFMYAKPNAAYCAGDSLNTNIIIRCNGYIGYPGNCNDNLSGDFPQGVNWAPCYQTSTDSSDAACSKNCIIYSGSGNYNGSSTTVPGCNPQPTLTSSTSTNPNLSTAPASSSHGSPPTPTSNGSTITTSQTNYRSATNIPVSPTTTGPVVFKGATAANQVCAALAIIGIVVAFFR